MSYPGNASLSPAVKDRVTSTFEQTLTLYHQGRKDEVAAGCDLILQMDPSFDPARKLMDKNRNPALPIDVDMLLPRTSGDPMQQARAAMAERDFERVLHLTSAVLSEDLLNDEARILSDEAREKLEAAPFVEQFARKSEQQIGSGNIAAAKMELEKARALDPTHPEVIRIGKMISERGTAPQPAQSTPSFVIDAPSPAATGRSTAQAADFGFAFEEEKPPEPEVSFSNFSFDAPASDSPFGGGFSFDAPSAPAPAPAASRPAPAIPSSPGDFDFATASVVTSADDQKKIDQYLADGDRASAAGDHQQAIDLWSRIFLIDVTNDDASERIERAKAKRRELDQKLEPLLASGIAAFDRGDTEKAHTDLGEVLRLDPRNATAQGYLDRLSETVTEGGAAASAQDYLPPAALSPSQSEDKLDLGFFDDEPSPYDLPAIPPPPAPAPAGKTSGKAEGAAKTASSGRQLPVGLIAGVVGLVVLLAAGWFIWSKYMTGPAEDTGAGQVIISRASGLAGAGKYDQAIALLQDIKPEDPQHDQALVMIADLRAKKSSSAQLVEGIPAAQYYEQKLAAGRTAFEAHDYAAAKAALDQAQKVKPLPPELKSQYDAAAQQVSKLDSAKALFNERKYADAIANLQPLLDQDPQNPNIRRIISNAHFNLGAMALQEEHLTDAEREFDEVLKGNPADELAKRSRELAIRYEGQPKDLLYRIYVKYLPLRDAA